MTMEILSVQLTTPQKVRYLFYGFKTSAVHCCIAVVSLCSLLYVIIQNIWQCFVFLALEQVDVVPVVRRDADHIAVITSNVLFFVILFIFAVFET